MFDLFSMSPQSIAAWFVILGQFFLFVKWLYRSYRNREIADKFVSDMASNHLPHIYHALQKIGNAAGIEIGDPPPMQWVKFNGNGQKNHDK